jgi:hypothetical protein
MLHPGIDLHRRSVVVCTVHEQGTVIDRRSMKTQPELIISSSSASYASDSFPI